ncbi:MAG: DUF4038 domain-containing protein [Ruminiclostridium sp.]|nr:DUF4038 domain-containing protein [Ruminiclostridium sp.]
MKISGEKVEKWDVFEVELISRKDFTQPFEEVELSACFMADSTIKKVNGFYDGNSTWKIWFMPEMTGEYKFRIESSNDEFDGLEGSFHSIGASPGNHGPVRIDKKYHFSYADGTPCFIMGTTIYAWTYRPQEIREKTLESLKKNNFNKARMLVFPKYLAGFDEIDLTYEPPMLPYEGGKHNLDYRSFNVEYFRNFEERVKDLQEIGTEADVILFHNYDFGMWGIDDGLSDDDALFYLKYLIARISAYRNVWWSLANEYDLYKEADGSGFRFKDNRRDWDRIGNYIMENDPYSHPRSIHECFRIYPDREWMTHVSCQKSNTYALMMDLKHRYKKPVIDDEYRYEGNLSYGWGNLSAQEELMRHWLSVMAGAYATHGECYVVGGNKKDIFWTYGGKMVGQSAPRLKFLKEVITELPFQEMAPAHDRADGCEKFCLSKAYDVHLFLLTDNCTEREISLGFPDGIERKYTVTVYDIWNCSIVDQVSGVTYYNASHLPGMLVVKAEKI